jgi:predicted amidohydrolase YtcJ
MEMKLKTRHKKCATGESMARLLKTDQAGSSRAIKPTLLMTICAATILTFGSVSIYGLALAQSPAHEVIYVNGDILTMEGDVPTYAQALVEKGGLIAFVGTRAEAARAFPTAQRRDLHGKTLLPGFIDAHGHLYLTGFFTSMANVMPGPDGPGSSHEAVVASTKAWMESETGKLFIRRFGWVLANGFDHSLMQEHTPPTADVLDRISTDYPVLMIHQSGHIGAVNTKGLELAKITRDTPDPAGGVIQRKADGSPNGVLEEAAFNAVANTILVKADAQIDALALERGQDLFARNGFTTAEDARAFPNITGALAAAATDKRLKLDVISYPDIVANAGALNSPFYRADRAYSEHYRIGGVKISLDGSPQAKTAWLTTPYLIHPPHTEEGYKGYAAMPDEKAFELFDRAASQGWQILCHANGDAAIDQCLNGMAHAQTVRPNPDHRSVVIHAQTMRADQVVRLAQLGGLPSFFSAHTFYWGDWHRDSVLGNPRAQRISPTRDALNLGMTLTSHHDSPVILPSAMRLVDAAVNRTTRTGRVLGPEQRLTPFEALKSITIWAARQHFEEDSKGTLRVGKRADLTILAANPLKVRSATINTISVEATIKDGHTIFCANPRARRAVCE